MTNDDLDVEVDVILVMMLDVVGRFFEFGGRVVKRLVRLSVTVAWQTSLFEIEPRIEL